MASRMARRSHKGRAASRRASTKVPKSRTVAKASMTQGAFMSMRGGTPFNPLRSVWNVPDFTRKDKLRLGLPHSNQSIA
jgi:hypothetical protein